jgi:hypothetical protein
MSAITIKSKVVTQFDIPEMMDIYSHHMNYEIMDLNKHDNRCIIYFSSHGLYYPNHSDVFRREILEKGRFEWKKNILRSASKAIFLRDVKKQWYLEGINAKINTIEKLATFLAEETRGMEVICVGSSAGGYVASLIGHLLNASHVFNFSGQFSLLDILRSESERLSNPTLIKYENIVEYRKYFSIVDFLKTSQTPIFYFFPAHSGSDIVQSKLVEDFKSVFQFRFDSEIHGVTCYEINFLDIFSQNKDALYKLYSYYHNSLISPFLFSMKTSGFTKSLMFKAKDEWKHFKTKKPLRRNNY